MVKIKEIKKHVESNKKLGFSGHKNMKHYLKEFSNEELDYIEMKFILEKESSERLLAFRNIAVLAAAIFAMFFDVSTVSQKESLSLEVVLKNIVVAAILCLLIYLFLSNFPSKSIDVSRTALLTINEIREDEKKED